MQEFKVNDYLSLKLENRETNIYINETLFRQCKSLLIYIRIEELTLFDEIESIDEATARSEKEIENFEGESMPSDVEFWGHCSNLQVWAENNYEVNPMIR